MDNNEQQWTTVDNKRIRLTHGEWAQLQSWQAGPDEIAICKEEKRCPICGANTHRTRVINNGRVSRGDFDIGYEVSRDDGKSGRSSSNVEYKGSGRAFGARCPWCGWSF